MVDIALVLLTLTFFVLCGCLLLAMEKLMEV